MVDSMLRDGLIDPFHNYHMGNTAENVAKKYQITRQEQDEFALASQNKAEAAIKGGKFKDEIVPVTIKTRKGDTVVDTDEHPIFGTTMEALAKLRPAFEKEGTVTAGNASGINDGGAAMVLMTAENAAKRGVEPLARIVAWATSGVDPAIMGTGPIPASRKALEKAGWTREGPRARRGERGLCRAGDRREPRAGLGYRHRQRQRRRHRPWPSHRLFRIADPADPGSRDDQAERQEGPDHCLRRRWHGHRHVRRARLAAPRAQAKSTTMKGPPSGGPAFFGHCYGAGW